MNLLSQFWVVPMTIGKLLLFSENSSKLVNEHTVILHPKNWNNKKLEKFDATFLQMQLFKLNSEGLADFNRRLGDADKPGFQRSW